MQQTQRQNLRMEIAHDKLSRAKADDTEPFKQCQNNKKIKDKDNQLHN